MTLRFLLATILVFLSHGAFAAKPAASCEKWLKGVSEYEDLINGKIVWKFSIFNFMNWDPNDQFSAAVLIKDVAKGQPAPTLEVKYESSASSKTEVQTFKTLLPFELDPRLKEFDDFKPNQFFRFEEPGRFTLTLKSGSTVLCSYTGKYRLGH